MKKFGKFVLSVATIAAAGAGAYYAYKKFIEKSNFGDEEENDDDLDEYDFEDEGPSKSPEYVSITPVKEAAEEVGDALEDAAEQLTENLEEAASDVAEAVEETAEKAAEAISDAVTDND